MRDAKLAGRVLSLLLVLVAGTLSGCTSSRAAVDQPLEVIDALVHTSFDNGVFAESEVMFSKVELAAEMKRYQIVGAVAMDNPGDTYTNLSGLNVVQCVGLAEHVDAGTLEADLASGSYRCIKIALGYQRRYASDPVYAPAYRLAERYSVPVVLQAGADESHHGKLFGAREVVARNPEVTFVLAHVGNSHTVDQRDRDRYVRSRTGPAVVNEFGDDLWIEQAASVAYRNPNVVLDGSGFLVGNLEAASPEQVATYLVRRVGWTFERVSDPTKLMFGSGWPRTAIGPYLEAFKRAIPPEHWQAVFHENAARVYGFAESSPASRERRARLRRDGLSDVHRAASLRR